MVGLIGMIAFFILMISRSKKKIKILYYDTDKTCQILTFDNKEIITIDEKKFILKDSKPSMHKTSLGWFPFYYLRYDKPTPITWKGSSKELKDDFNPNMINSMVGMESLKTLLTMKQKGVKGNDLMLIIIGAVCGLLGGIVLCMTGIIKVPVK